MQHIGVFHIADVFGGWPTQRESPEDEPALSSDAREVGPNLGQDCFLRISALPQNLWANSLIERLSGEPFPRVGGAELRSAQPTS